MQPDTVTAGAGADTVVNNNFRALSPSGLYGIRPGGTAGLVLGYFGGEFNGVTVANGTVTLTASSTNYVVANRTTGAVTAATNTTNWLDTANYMQLYQLVAGTASFTIAATSDKRQAYGGAGGSGGSFTGGTLTSALNEAPPVTIASAATVNIGAAAANTVLVSGTTTITAFDTIAAGAIRRIRFLGALTLTHNGTSLILPAATNITTAAGDVATFESLGSGNWRCIDYARADGTALVGGSGSGTVTSVDASGGVETASGSAITSTGTIRQSELVNPQTGTTYTYLTGDRGKLVTHSNASAIAATLPQATGTFPAGWRMRVKNKGAGTLTITPTTSTIDGAATLVLTTGQWAVITSDGANYQATSYTPGAASLSNWTESVTTAVPNASVPAIRFIATNAASNADAVLSAKGVGSILAQVPDNTATGGNKRGTDAIDWQKSRNNALNVASGANAVISGGYDNRASNTYSAIIGGTTNISSGSASTAGGSSNTASGANSFAIGFAVTASGDTSFACGSGGTADAIYSMVTGRNARARGITAVHAFSSGNVSSAGDVQARRLHVFCNTTDATLKALTAGGAAASATNNIAIPTAGAAAFRAIVCAKQVSAGTDCKSWEVTGLIKNPAGTISFVGTPTVTVIAADAGAAAWTLTVAADNTLKVLRLDATGAAATGIYWSGVIEVAEVLN